MDFPYSPLRPRDPTWFPPTHHADPDGLLAYGGDLSPARLLAAYQRGIFPWSSDDEPLLWWSPDPRCVLVPDELSVSHSMRSVLRKDTFAFRHNTACAAVIEACRTTPRVGQDGTWIMPEIKAAYLRLHALGVVHSAEAWQDDRLVGGLYGVWLGGVFFGESMFSHVPNASKFAFIRWVQHAQAAGVALIDCQQATSHLLSLGARLIPRADFEARLARLIG
ncbi:MAG: leucyl/phenylalanyl-tRNA--protein transferase [Hymenobacteraceae bacterium]|nr:leucyl/phenylalanyl-tRNA--protein transferase [Hymenobacteraceae bacterium]